MFSSCYFLKTIFDLIILPFMHWKQFCFAGSVDEMPNPAYYLYRIRATAEEVIRFIFSELIKLFIFTGV